MPELFLIPFIKVPEIHDAAIREWLSRLEDIIIKDHLEYPFKLERFFPESARRAILRGGNVHDEILSLLNNIDPQAVFLDISTDYYELENKYNKRLISPHEFWLEYYENFAKNIQEPARTLYGIYMEEIIDRNIGLVESKERLPLNVLFYGLDIKSEEELIPVFKEASAMAEEFTLQIARSVNEIINLREKPEHLWYSSFTRISYEETEKFYDELLYKLKRLLRYNVREYFVKSLREQARSYVDVYEKFLDNKIIENEIKFSNIKEGINLLKFQLEHSQIVILCDPMDYIAILDHLKNNLSTKLSGISIRETNLDRLFGKMKPFLQKSRIMQSNYEIALNIIEREKPERYEGSDIVLVSHLIF